MNPSRLKNLSLMSIVVSSAVVLIGWSQTWFVLTTQLTADGAPVTIAGQQVGSGVSGLALASLALVAALALVRFRVRQVLGFILFLLGAGISAQTIAAWSNPVAASAPILSGLSGLSDGQALAGLVSHISTTPWPAIV